MSPADRRWLEIRVRCSSAGDLDALLADALVELGGRSVEERSGWYITHVPEPADVDSFRRVAGETIASHTGLSGVEIELEWRPDEEWAETWKRGLTLRRLTDRIAVRPSWITPTEAEVTDVTIVIDPGMAFGTAEHGTTRGCLRLLDGVVAEGDRVLDVGAGSGILSVAAALLGASEVVAIEGDALACETLSENLDLNGIEDVQIVQAWVDSDRISSYGPASGVVSNIETGLLVPLLPGLVGALERGGWLIVSGIVATEWAEVEERLEARGFELVERDADGEWRSGLFKPRA